MKFYFILFVTTCSLSAQSYTLPLWNKEIPNYKATGENEKSFIHDGIYFINNIQNPNITVYLPPKNLASGEAVVICPGGGYHNLAYNWEGSIIAKALNSKGIAGIVLKYRLPTTNNYIVKHKSPLLDAQRAIRLVRHHATAWNINPSKVGIMGFSAGGHLASTLSTHYDKGNLKAKNSIEQLSCKPDFSLLIYSVISFNDTFTHKGSKEALIGKNPSQELLQNFSNELQVTPETPPAFLVHASDDDAVPVKNSLVYYEALQKNKVSAELHIYPHGGHGFSLATHKDHLEGWIDLCTDWIHYITKENNNE